MIFESVESFVGQLILHKYNCKKGKGELKEIFNTMTPVHIIQYKCDTCEMHWEMDPDLLRDTAFQYIRGEDKKIFREFLSKMDCSIYPGSSYENLFAVYSVMFC